MSRFSRRRLLQGALAGGVAGAAGLRFSRSAHADDDGPRYLITIGCFGGASMMDCFMPVDVRDAVTDPNRGTLNSYETVQPEGSHIRCVDRDMPRRFLERYAQDTVVMGTMSSSVNHWVAQARAINGRDVFAGRTLAEAVAAVHGEGMALPNVNMGRGGYTVPGADPGLDGHFRAEMVTNPVTFALSTHGHAGILPLGDTPAQDPDIREALIQRTRTLRDGELEALSPFGRTFANSQVRRDLLWARQTGDPQLELEDLIQRLLFVPDLGDAFPLSEYGLTATEEISRIRSALPDSFPANTSGTARDRMQAQAALAYLLIRTGAGCAVTLVEPGTDGFLAFDLSHTDHKSAQAAHWDRVLDAADRLIQLLSSAEHYDAEGQPTGTTLWDRTMIVFATEFGRDKWDTGRGFGTGHHLNNGLLVVSPLLAGNQTLGVTDPNNGFICGFDPDDGTPTPFDELGPGEDPLFDDPRLPPSEERVYGALADVLGVSFDGQETLGVIKG
ncbi:MAG: hypothetical protein H6741_16245 [Alphaproteobacteria bacterium]|nr:hypothetical protein [Alphaproteobacteria bacterium]MCB9794265.1 hypothetical protein [Alphaproteobacteria bacterium]